MLSALAVPALAALAAQDSFIIGPRATGMGGTGVASAEGTAAAWYNPALLASDRMGAGQGRPWDIGVLDVSAGLRVHGDLLEIASSLADADIAELGANGIENQADLRRAVGVVVDLSQIGNAGNAVTGDASTGLGVRIGRWHLGVRMTGQSSALVEDTDLANLAFGAVGGALAQAVNASGGGQDGTFQVLSDQQRDDLFIALDGGNGGFDAGSQAGQAVLRLDFALRERGLDAGQTAEVVQVLEAAATASGGIDGNTTAVTIGTFLLSEVPLSAGWALNQSWAVGGSLKLLVGRVYGTRVRVFDDDAALHFDQGIDDFEQTVTWGIDAGVTFRNRWLTVGLTGRNLNGPDFDGFTDQNGVAVADVEVEPQVTIGIAVSPLSWFTAALDADLTAAETTFPGYETQRVGLGIEFRAWRLAALRAGVYQNIAEDDIGPVFTLGVGVGLGPVHIDVALASSTELTPILDADLPDEMRASFALAVSF